MATREQKLQVLLNTLGADEMLRLAPTITDDADDDGGDAASKAKAAEAAAEAKAESTNPFVKGKNFSLAEQGRLYRNPKTRGLAIRLAAKAGVKLPENPLQNDLDAHFAPVRYGQ